MASLKKFPFRFWIGIVLVGVFWYLNWCLTGVRTNWAFFPLWLGYSLVVDGIVYVRKGSSLFSRSIELYILLFVVSAPCWWLFELLNYFTQNWTYYGSEHFSALELSLFKTLSFTTVIPSVFGTAELVSTFKWMKKINKGPVVKPTFNVTITFFFVGWVMLVLLILFPNYFFVFIWLSVFFITEPVNVWFNNRTLMKSTGKGDWRLVISLWLGCLICGFFWEMWNYYSYPKWIYSVPFVDFMHIFEMPVLGYLGYLPFSLELFALYQLIAGIFQNTKMQNYLSFEFDKI